MKTHDIKKIMKGLCVDKSQTPGVRFEVVMDGIPEELQKDLEEAIKEFEVKAMDIVTAVSETMSKDNQIV